MADVLRPFGDRLRDKKVLVMEGAGETTDAPGEAGPKYDVVVFSAIGGSPAAVIARAGDLLVPGGALMIGVENDPGAKNGQKGAPALPAKHEFAELARQAGFRYCSFYYPFPDIDSPEVLLSEGAFDSPLLNVGNLIEPVLKSGRCMREQLFVVVSDNADWLPSPDLFAWTFNPARTMPYRKMTTFYLGEDGDLWVRRQRYGSEGDTVPEGPVRQELREERYLPGRLYSLELCEIVSRKGWSARDVAEWARRFLEVLRRHAGEDGWLEGRYLDLVPFNLVDRQGGLAPIDLEWVAAGVLTTAYVFFRGLYHSLARVGPVAMPVEGTPMNLYSLCLAIAGALFPSTEGMLEDFLTLEPRYFGAVFGGDGRAPGDNDLVVSAVHWVRPLSPGNRLYPLSNLNVQIFVERSGQGFGEETSTMLHIGLTVERKVYSVVLPHFTGDVVKLRIDPSDHSGLVQLHAVHLRSEGEELFYWTPYSRMEVELNGVMLLNAAPSLPCPVMVLLNYDPMLIFSLPAVSPGDAAAPVVLELEVSALAPGLYDAVRNSFAQLCEMLCEK
jgi:hypothetical protein